MASINKNIFSWQQVDAKDDLQRLRLVLENIPDEPLMRLLEKERGRGRDDYPVRAMWNSLLVAEVFQHSTVASLRRELLRNPALREICGFDPVKGGDAVPTPSAYSRMIACLKGHLADLDAIFDALVARMAAEIPGFARTLAVDSKPVEAAARPRRKDSPAPPADGRRDADAVWGKRTVFEGFRRRLESYFGYKFHLVIDAELEMPVAKLITPANAADQPAAHKLFDHLSRRHPDILENCEYLCADKGYDGRPFIIRMWDEHRIRPVIPIREDWRDDKTRLVNGRDNVTYDQQGILYCHPRSGAPKRMPYGGFEKERQALKYLCPAKHYGCDCPDRDECPVKGSVRVYLDDDRRVFKPLPFHSYKGQSVYARRTAAERVNSRLALGYGFDDHLIRGMAKMAVRLDLSLIVMLSLALGQARENRPDLMRSLTRGA